MKRAFTLIELLVVVAMIAILLGTLTTSVASARARAKIQKATAEVKVISQAILAYENWDKDNQLPDLSDQPADKKNLDFLLGKKSAESSGKIPVLLMAQLQNDGRILDPWGNVYKIKISSKPMPSSGRLSGLKTGYQLPNYYRITPEERP